MVDWGAVLQLLIAVVLGAVLTWVGQWLNGLQQRRDQKGEKLTGIYDELLAFASADLYRAKQLEAGLAIETLDLSVLAALDKQRHDNTRELNRLACQIRTRENDTGLCEKVAKLAESQPFILATIPVPWHKGNFNERFEKYQSDIAGFHRQINVLMDAVKKRHNRDHFLAVSFFRKPTAQAKMRTASAPSSATS